ncbi:hypothetical protein Solca_2765 [Solitalea canadensis DSM 3403]|uniref:Uncharacterized protein n=1 Tax=Solitalea canadensis (strain ATCC 29591 / DSM 3403 / JCM 21819 / LMG 8368 / NBRC 15130 / NCIMB 12057 / USAM 9D) TaxID=929556 RepID=H8KS06_SOLCM|nr:hypothetical protein Solca_2765 [Solitalea canadensis DSM 3403]
MVRIGFYINNGCVSKARFGHCTKIGFLVFYFVQPTFRRTSKKCYNVLAKYMFAISNLSVSL